MKLKLPAGRHVIGKDPTAVGTHCHLTLMSITQNEKAARFRALHECPGAFVIPNPWDIGSARILAGLGFQALATSSAAASAVGRKDHELTREESLAHTRLIVDATDLPVSADLPECNCGSRWSGLARNFLCAGRVEAGTSLKKLNHSDLLLELAISVAWVSAGARLAGN